MFCSIFVSLQMSDIWDESFVVLVLFLYVLFFLLFLVSFQISLKELFAYLRSAFVVLLLPVTSKPPNWPNSKVSYSHRLRLCVIQYRTMMGWRNIKNRRKRNRTIVSIMCALYGFCVFCNCLNVCRLCWRWQWLIHGKILVLLARFCLVARAP